jgi:hypothetical protein
MALFVLLTLLISWAFVIPADGGLIPYGPMIAAFIVLAVVGGRRGVTGRWAQMIRWCVGWKWYVGRWKPLDANRSFQKLIHKVGGYDQAGTWGTSGGEDERR